MISYDLTALPEAEIPAELAARWYTADRAYQNALGAGDATAREAALVARAEAEADIHTHCQKSATDVLAGLRRIPTYYPNHPVAHILDRLDALEDAVVALDDCMKGGRA